MKKSHLIFIILISLVLFSILSGRVNAPIDDGAIEPSCSDTDGGNVPLTAGSCNDGYSYPDSCTSTINLKEYYCTGSYGSCTYTTYNCTAYCINAGKKSGSCSNGACVCVTCNSDSECNDNNPCTTDKCNNPGLTTSSCSHSNVADSTSCGTNKYCCSGVCVAFPGTYNSACGSCGYLACSGATYKCYDKTANGGSCLSNSACCSNNCCYNIYGGSCCASGTSCCIKETCTGYDPETGDCRSYSYTYSCCLSTQVCSGGTCVTPSCTSNSNCNDNNICTIDTCNNPGQYNAYCSYSWTNNCDATTHTNCQSQTCAGSTYYCSYDGSSWRWRSPAPSEVCTDHIDNNCDGKCDYDSMYCSHGDSACPVAVTAIAVSDSSPVENTIIQVTCTVSVAVNSISAYIDSNQCSWTSWNGNNAIFNCNVGSAGTKTAKCTVDTTKSYQSGSDKTQTITVRPSACSGYLTSSSCAADSRCEWCNECSGVKYSGGISRCINKGSCTYYCWKGKCGASCDNTQGGCSDYCSGNTRYYSGVCTSNCACSYQTQVCSYQCSNGQCVCDLCKCCLGGYADCNAACQAVLGKPGGFCQYPSSTNQAQCCGCYDCLPGTDIITHSAYPTGDYSSTTSTKWSHSVCGSNKLCKDYACKIVDADITSYNFPLGKIARSDTLSIPYTLKNVGDTAWTFLVESHTVKSDGNPEWPGRWETLSAGVSTSNSLAYNIKCSDPIGTWTGDLYSYTDLTAYGGWNVWSTPPNSFQVVECLNDADCTTCKGSNYICSNNVCIATQQHYYIKIFINTQPSDAGKNFIKTCDCDAQSTCTCTAECYVNYGYCTDPKYNTPGVSVYGKAETWNDTSMLSSSDWIILYPNEYVGLPYFTEFSYSGHVNYFNVFWNVSYVSTSRVNVSCIFNCDPRIQNCAAAQKCSPYPVVQYPGRSGCTVLNPVYNYTRRNKIFCNLTDNQNANIFRVYPANPE